MTTQEDSTRERRTWQEELTATGEDLLDRVKSLVQEGNIRKLNIKQDDRTLVELPLSVGVVGMLLAPQLAAVGAIAALVTRCTITVEREGSPEKDEPEATLVSPGPETTSTGI